MLRRLVRDRERRYVSGSINGVRRRTIRFSVLTYLAPGSPLRRWSRLLRRMHPQLCRERDQLAKAGMIPRSTVIRNITRMLTPARRAGPALLRAEYRVPGFLRSGRAQEVHHGQHTRQAGAGAYRQGGVFARGTRSLPVRLPGPIHVDAPPPARSAAPLTVQTFTHRFCPMAALLDDDEVVFACPECNVSSCRRCQKVSSARIM